MKRSIIVLVFLNLVFGIHILQANGLCGDRLFNISTPGFEKTITTVDPITGGEGNANAEQQVTTNNVSIGELISILASECGYSILVKDKVAQEMLSNNIPSVNITQLPVEKIFDLILTDNELSYEFDGNSLKISFLVTETFQINYIGTSRVGASNTDIILSQNANTTTDSTSSSSTTTTGSGLQDGDTTGLDGSVHRSLTSNGLQGGSIDSISGAKIMSMDQFDFWGRIEKEIFEIAFRPGDAYQPQKVFSTDTSSGGSGSGSGGNAQGQNNANTSSNKGSQSVIINKIAGLITVTGTIKQIERVRKYIKNLEDQMQNQVMIDVNILTVTHSNSNTVGVDWNQFWNFGNLMIPAYTDGGTSNSQISFTGSSTINLFSQGVELTRIVEFLNSYGKVRSVSNPKVLTMSNQPALISVGSVLRYQQSSVYQTSTSGGSNTNTSTSFPSVFAGVLLDVTPSVQGEYIMLKINPSITSTKDATTENQATALSAPPNLSTNQLSSLVRAKDGDKVVLGGLISKNINSTTSRVPVLGYIPILKYLFSYDGMTEETTEMIIVITPHIIKRTDDNPSLQDLGYSETVNEIILTNDAKAGLEDNNDE